MMKLFFLVISILIVGVFPAFGDPFILNPNFLVEEYISGLTSPTAMTFVNDDILVIEKGTGNVKLIRNGTLFDDPVLHVDVSAKNERGLLGITSIDSEIYLYFTASEDHRGIPIANQIHRYVWDGESLIHDSLIRQIPTDPKDNSMHNGGAMVVDNGIVYATVGDARMTGILQNYENGDLEDTGIILIVNFNESVLTPSQSENPQNYYKAIGIRNSFGLAVDPITGNLWDTENGPQIYDEINLIEPKFNSGWAKIMGPASEEDILQLPSFHDFKYSDPEFSWEDTVAPTAIIFVTSDLFKNYQNSVFVGDYNTGSLYRFTLNEDRSGFVFHDPSLQDLVLNFDDSDFEITFGKGFLGIVDLEFGPDGILYVLSIGDGKIYKIIPTTTKKIHQTEEIPPWTKKLFSWWNNDKIDDNSILLSLEYLISKNIIVLNNLPEKTSGTYIIPNNLKNHSLLWSQGQITSKEFGSSLTDLVTDNIISIDSNEIKCNSKPKFMSDFSGCDFSNFVLSKMDISYSNLSETLFESSLIYNTNLLLSDLSGSEINNTVFDSIDFRGGNLSKSHIINSKFVNSNLSGGDFREINAFNVNFFNSTMHYINFENSNLQEVDFSNSLLHRAKLMNTDLTNSDFSDAILPKAFLSNSTFKTSNFQGANAEKIRASNSNFEEANFSNSLLKKANLNDSNFKNANFEGANLKDIRANNSNFEEANFSNSLLNNASLKDSNFKNANLSGADLTNANIRGADFTGATMTGCIGCPWFLLP